MNNVYCIHTAPATPPGNRPALGEIPASAAKALQCFPPCASPHRVPASPRPGSAAGSRSLTIQDAKSKPSHISEWTVGRGSSGSSSLGLHPFPSPTDYPRAQENPRRGDFSEELKAPTGKRERHKEQEDHGAENEEYVPCMALVVAQHYYIKNYSSKTLHIQSSGSK